MSKNSYGYLAKNVGLLTLSNFATKILSFFLIPVYTNILTTSEYGIYDIVSTSVLLLTPILTINIMEPVMRFSMEKDADQKGIFTVGMRYFSASCLLLFLFLGINAVFGIFPAVSKYALFFFCLYVASTLSGIVSGFARGLDMVADVAVSGVITTIVTIALNILCLVVLEWGLTGYFIANIAGFLLPSIYLLLRMKFWRYITIKKPDKKLHKDMIAYGRPMIATNIAWWVNSMADRYVVVLLCGINANGIYSVASKIPIIMNILQSIFNQAWTLSAVKDFDSEDKDGFFADIYNKYSALMVIVCSALIVLDRPLARFLYAKDFYAAWEYVPFLLISVVFGAMSGYLNGIFSALKKVKILASSTSIGAVVNLILNFSLVFFIGPIGAAIATAVSYVVVWVIRIVVVRKYMTLKINLLRDCVAYAVLTVQAVLLVVFKTQTVWLYGALVIGFIISALLYVKDIVPLIKTILAKFLKRKA